MEHTLRPMTLGEILDRTAELYRENFLLFAGIASLYAALVLVLGLLQVGLAEVLRVTHQTHPLQWITWTLAAVSALLSYILLGTVIAAVSRAVAWVHLGEPASIRSAYASILPRLGRYLWLMTLTFLLVWLPVSLLYGGYFGMLVHYVAGYGTDPAATQAALANQSTIVAFGIISGIFFLLLIPTGIYTILMGLRYSLAVPACVVEGLQAWPSLKRSVTLAKGTWGRIFLLLLLIAAIKFGLGVVTQIFILIPAFKHPGQPLPVWATVLSQLIGFFTNSFLAPLGAIGVTLFYYDQRVRKEGFDIEWMMQAAGLSAPQVVATDVAIGSDSAEPTSEVESA